VSLGTTIARRAAQAEKHSRAGYALIRVARAPVGVSRIPAHITRPLGLPLQNPGTCHPGSDLAPELHGGGRAALIPSSD